MTILTMVCFLMTTHTHTYRHTPTDTHTQTHTHSCEEVQIQFNYWCTASGAEMLDDFKGKGDKRKAYREPVCVYLTHTHTHTCSVGS